MLHQYKYRRPASDPFCSAFLGDNQLHFLLSSTCDFTTDPDIQQTLGEINQPLQTKDASTTPSAYTILTTSSNTSHLAHQRSKSSTSDLLSLYSDADTRSKPVKKYRLPVRRTRQADAVVAQIESQPPLCLSQAGSPYGITAGINFGGVSKYSSKKQRQRVSSSANRSATTFTLDIASLLKRDDSNESTFLPNIPQFPQTARQLLQPAPLHSVPPPASVSSTRPPSGLDSTNRGGMSGHGQDQPVKKQTKWSPEEDAIIIELRGSGMKWDDVSKRLPGRSPISCRLHYQNYLERRSEWNEERKDKLARLYDRFKAEMWAKVAEELAVPWRAAEAMHWQLGEAEMAKRAGVVPFSLAAVNAEAASRNPHIRGHTHSQSQESMPRDIRISPQRHVYGPGQQRHGSMVPHRESIGIMPSSVPQPQYAPAPPPTLALQGPGPAGPPSVASTPAPPSQPLGPPSGEFHYQLGRGLPPIQAHPNPRVPGPLPGVAELTTGISPYATPPSGPAQQLPPPPPNMHHGMPQQQAMYAEQEPNRLKRPASPEMRMSEGNYRRRMS